MVSVTVGGETLRCALARPFVSAVAVGAAAVDVGGGVAGAGLGDVGVADTGLGDVGVAGTGLGDVGVAETGLGELVGAADPEGVGVPEPSAVGGGVSA